MVQGPAVLVGNSLGSLVAITCAVFFPGAGCDGVVAAPLPDPTLADAASAAAAHAAWRPWQRPSCSSWLVSLLCRLLPLELLVPLIARTPLLDLGLQSAPTATSGDRWTANCAA